MRKAVFILCAILSQVVFAAPSSRLIDALSRVESRNTSHAVGDNGRAVGIL